MAITAVLPMDGPQEKRDVRCCYHLATVAEISLTPTQAKSASNVMSAQALYPMVHMPKPPGIEAKYTK